MERFHIVAVDDVPDAAESLAELLTLWEYDATACTSGVAALACAAARRPAVVLLDLVMPRMDGFAFVRAFREVPGCGSVPVVALSGYATPECFARARRFGIEHFVLKPAPPQRLRRLIVALTHGAAAPVPAGGPWNSHRTRDQWVRDGPVLV